MNTIKNTFSPLINKIGASWVVIPLLSLHVLFSLYGSWKGFTGNFDTGTVELMAVNIARGEDFPLFWYGLHYAGALEAYVAAAMIRLFGFSELALSLSPILFSTLWILGTWLLFAEILDRRAGTVAALASVFSGYFIRYYGYALSGGYAVILALGTLVLWLGVRIWRRDPDPRELWPQVVAIGLMSGLAIWVHFFVFPYLAATAVLLLAHWIRRRFALPVLFCYAVGAALAGLGLLPFVLVARSSEATGSIAGFIFNSRHLWHSFLVLVQRDLAAMVFWKGGPAQPWVHWLGVCCAALVLFLALSSLVLLLGRSRWRRDPAFWAPVVFLLVFLAMFLPHRMAIIPSPRYVLGFWAMLVAMGWSFCWPGKTAARVWKTGGTVLLGAWILYNGAGEWFFMQGMARAKAINLERTTGTLDMVREAGVQGVFMLGSEQYGFGGQKLSAFTGNRIRFVFTGKERFQKNAQAIETEPRYGLMCLRGDRPRVVEALRPLRLDYRLARGGGNVLFYRFSTDLWRQQSLKPAALRVIGGTGEPDALIDRNGDTSMFWPRGEKTRVVEVEFAGEKKLSSLWLFGVMAENEGEIVGLPTSFRIDTARTGEPLRTVFQGGGRVNQSYVQDGHVYVSGYFGKMEIRLDPAPVHRLRIVFTGPGPVRLSELYWFEGQDRQPAPDREEVKAVAAALRARRARFTMADRWLSAALIQEMDGQKSPVALPRFNPRGDDQAVSRLVIPRQGLVVAPERAVADECVQLLTGLYGEGVIVERREMNHWTLLFLGPSQRQGEDFLYWNGHVLERLSDYARLGRIRLTGTGLLRVDPSQARGRGFYRDGWTNGDGRLLDLDLDLSGTSRMLVVTTGGNAPRHGDPGQIQLQVLANDQPLVLQSWNRRKYIYALPPEMKRIHTLRIRSISFTPGNGDTRTLGLDVNRILVL